MNFDNAINSHAQWKRKLASYLSKPDQSLKASVIGVDNECELGKWLHGEGGKYSKLPEFSTLMSDHARFHQAAADVVRRADSGQKVSDEVALGSNSKFGAASTAVVKSLMAMKSEV